MHRAAHRRLAARIGGRYRLRSARHLWPFSRMDEPVLLPQLAQEHCARFRRRSCTENSTTRKFVAPGPANGLLERSEQHLGPEAGKASHRAHRDVNWIPVLVQGPRAMAHVRSLRWPGPRPLLRLAGKREAPTVLEGELDRNAARVVRKPFPQPHRRRLPRFGTCSLDPSSGAGRRARRALHSDEMADPARRPATYDDLFALPPHVTGQIVFGVLHAHPRPAPSTLRQRRRWGEELGPPFKRGARRTGWLAHSP